MVLGCYSVLSRGLFDLLVFDKDGVMVTMIELARDFALEQQKYHAHLNVDEMVAGIVLRNQKVLERKARQSKPAVTRISLKDAGKRVSRKTFDEALLERVWLLIKDNPGCTSENIQNWIGMSRDTARVYARELIKRELIRSEYIYHRGRIFTIL